MSSHRHYAIDHLRTCMMFVVMLGHPLLPYVTVPRVFNDPYNHIGFDYFAVFLYAFAMQTFFVTAGFSAALVLQRKGAIELWKNRFIRIFLPLLVAYICISPLMRGAYQFAAGVVEYNSIRSGWSIFLEAEWLRWGKVYHLWFLLSLLIFTALSCIGLWCLSATNLDNKISSTLARWLRAKYGLLGLIMFISISTVPSYVLDTGRGTHWSMQITLWMYFVLGWFIYHNKQVITLFVKVRQKALLGAVIIVPICIWATRERLFNEHNVDLVTGLVAGISNGILGACMTITLIGWFYIRFDKTSRLAQEFGKASYWVYLVHFPIVVAVGGIVSTLEIHAAFKYGLTISCSIPIIAITYFVLVLNTPLRYVIVGKSRS